MHFGPELMEVVLHPAVRYLGFLTLCDEVQVASPVSVEGYCLVAGGW